MSPLVAAASCVPACPYIKKEVLPMKVVDSHAHIYPEKIVQKAVDSVGDFYTTPMIGDGTVEGLLASRAVSPISHYIVHSVAVKSGTVESINDFISEQASVHPEFIGFAAMHQDYPDKEKEINRAIELGLKGVKVHPDVQECNLDDPRFMELYEIIETRLPIILHTGDYRYDYSHPRRLKKVLKAFPDLKVNAAHFGGWSIPELAYDLLKDEQCFVDMSSSMAFLGDRRTEELIRMYGIDRVLFGSDFPMWNPAKEYQRFASLGFSEDEYEKLLYGNAERFLGFEV